MYCMIRRTANGHLLRRFAPQGAFELALGVALASCAFSLFSGQILLGNFGDGQISVFDSNGNFLAQLANANDKVLVIHGLWALTLGGGAQSSSDTLYFTAGPNHERSILARLHSGESPVNCCAGSLPAA